MRLLLIIFLALLFLPGAVRGEQITAPTSKPAKAPEEYGGIGLSWTTDEAGLTVFRILKDGPADRAGIKTGDRLLTVDGQPVGMILEDQISEKVRGKTGTEVVLTFAREGTPEPISFRIVREKIDSKWPALQERHEYEAKLGKLQPLAERGNPEAQLELGKLYQNGQGVEQNYAEGMKWFLKAADKGNTAAQQEIAYMYRRGDGVKKDNAEWLKWLLKAAEHGDAKAQYWLGNAYEHETEMVDYGEAFKWYRKAAEQGYADAEFFLSTMYSNGRGVKKDETEAANWLRKSADHGRNDAKLALAFRQLTGNGVTQDYAAAIKVIRPFAEKGSQGAQGALGKLYATGHGVEQNYEEAYYWLSLPSKCHRREKETETALAEVTKHLTSEQIAAADIRVAKFKWPRYVGRAGAQYVLPDGKKVWVWTCGCACVYTDPSPPIGPPAPKKTALPAPEVPVKQHAP